MTYRPITPNRNNLIHQVDLSTYTYAASTTLVIYPIDVASLELTDGDGYIVEVWGDFVDSATNKGVALRDDVTGFNITSTTTPVTTGLTKLGWKFTYRITKVTGTTYTMSAIAASGHAFEQTVSLRTTLYSALSEVNNLRIVATGSPAAGETTVKGMKTTRVKI